MSLVIERLNALTRQDQRASEACDHICEVLFDAFDEVTDILAAQTVTAKQVLLELILDAVSAYVNSKKANWGIKTV